MLDFLKRHKLQRQGYSCGKKRKEQTSSEWAEPLRTSPYIRWLIVAGFLFVLGLLVRSADSTAAFSHLGEGMGVATMIALVPLSLAWIKLNLRRTWERNGEFLLAFGVVLLHLTLLSGVWWAVRLNQLSESFMLFLAPVALAPILMTLLLGRQHGLFAAVFCSLWGALLVHVKVALPFALMSSVTGVFSVWAVWRLRKRSQLLRAGLLSGVVAFACCVVLGLSARAWWATGTDLLGWQAVGIEAGVVILAGIFTAMIAGGLLPVLEALFRITTAISWLELADLNHPLLRRMALEAPGSYQHSLMVANMSESAAELIGADTTICRVCSYFHDIGKLNKPEYCIENHSADEENPHDELKPAMSALVVIAHVKDGVDLACRHKLNREIIDVIQQHHGTSLVYYFYRRALDQQEEAKRAVAEGRAAETDIPEVKEASFRYPGPKPSFRESAIISLADAVESASRTLTKVTPQKIEALVDEIIRSRFRDGQLDECDLRMHELSRIRDSFTKTLRTSLHRRIPYPEDRKDRDRDDVPGSIIERREDRERTRQLRSGTTKTTPLREDSTATASNIIPMPGTPPDKPTGKTGNKG